MPKVTQEKVSFSLHLWKAGERENDVYYLPPVAQALHWVHLALGQVRGPTKNYTVEIPPSESSFLELNRTNNSILQFLVDEDEDRSLFHGSILLAGCVSNLSSRLCSGFKVLTVTVCYCSEFSHQENTDCDCLEFFNEIQNDFCLLVDVVIKLKNVYLKNLTKLSFKMLFF